MLDSYNIYVISTMIRQVSLIVMKALGVSVTPTALVPGSVLKWTWQLLLQWVLRFLLAYSLEQQPA